MDTRSKLKQTQLVCENDSSPDDEKTIDDPLPEWRARRDLAKASLARFVAFVNKCDNTLDNYEQLKIQIERVQRTCASFDSLQDNIELADSNEIQSGERELFEDDYITYLAKARAILRSSERGVVGSATVSSSVQPAAPSVPFATSSIHLPSMQLPSFSGSHDEWVTFHDRYVSLIHNNTTLASIQKLHYLKSCLKGDASRIIVNIELTDNNYEPAWEAVKNRFENKKLIVETHIRAILDAPKMQKESSVELAKLLDEIERHLSCLRALQIDITTWDPFLNVIITQRLCASSRRDWEMSHTSREVPKLEDLLDFLNKRCRGLEAIGEQKPFGNRNNALVITTPQGDVCLFCKQIHAITACARFLSLQHDEKLNFVKKMGMCFNCLRKGHTTVACKSKFRCKHCTRMHHSLLHATIPKPKEVQPVQVQAPVSSEVCLFNSTCVQTLLPTAIVDIQDRSGRFVECRVLLDSASQSHFITSECCEKLGLQKQQIHYEVSGISSKNISIQYSTSLLLKSKCNEFNRKLNCLVIDQITGSMPRISFDARQLSIPDDITLADPSFNETCNIDILLGAPLFFYLLCQGQINLGRQQPVLQKTVFGWVVSGSMSPLNSSKVNCFFTANLDPLSQQLNTFWELEEVKSQKILSPEEQFAKDSYISTTKRTDSGRVIVTLPFIKPLDSLGTSRTSALKQFYALEQRLDRDLPTKLEYTKVMREYISLNHMAPVDESNPTRHTYYLPHHPVVKESSTTTKLRVVFNASHKTSTGVSLNDLQANGPQLQQELSSILIRFRLPKYAISADLEKMYRQILVTEAQRSLQRVFWRENSCDMLICYEIYRLTFGMKAAAYLAIESLFYTALPFLEIYPRAVEVLRRETYVDDVLSGANSLRELLELKEQLDTILNSAGFVLRKWCSNCVDFMKTLDTTDEFAQGVQLGDDSVKTLGIFWRVSTDQLAYQTSFTDSSQVTKRVILSVISQIYDPLGLLTPVVMKSKVFIQKLWRLQLDWDESVPLDVYMVEFIQGFLSYFERF